jgi:hypothetical protein
MEEDKNSGWTESDYFLLAEKLKSKSAEVQVIYNYDAVLDGWNLERSLKQTNDQAKKLYRIAENVLEGGQTDEDKTVQDDFYAGTLIAEDSSEEDSWIVMDADTLSDEHADVVEDHRYNMEKAEERSGEELLREVVDDYKFLTYSITEYDLTEDVEIPSKDRNGTEIVE